MLTICWDNEMQRNCIKIVFLFIWTWEVAESGWYPFRNLFPNCDKKYNGKSPCGVGKCQDVLFGYVCRCSFPYKAIKNAWDHIRSGCQDCCVIPDPCASHNCGIHRCTPYDNIFHYCECVAGYKQHANGVSCESICEAESYCEDTGEVNSPTGTCEHRSTEPYYSCVCKDNFAWSVVESRCKPTESLCSGKCRHTSDVFSPAANSCSVINSPPFFRCDCKNGLTWDIRRQQCIDYICSQGDKCLDMGNVDSPAGADQCLNIAESPYYACVCKSGFVWNKAKEKCEVTDSFCTADKCVKTDDPLSPQSMSCHIIAEDPFYTCECNWGYQWNARTEKCEDIDECAVGYVIHEGTEYDVCPQELVRCQNEVGGYRCLCEVGYNPQSPKPSQTQLNTGCYDCCEDINECNIPSTCDGKCTNLFPLYECECPDGFKYNVNEKQCQNVDECLDISNAVCNEERSTCVDTEGSYRCECKKGYERQEGADESCHDCCVDIDECVEGNPCEHGGCVNAFPHYTCNCQIGSIWDIETLSCVDDGINECLDTENPVCDLRKATCVNENGYECHCLAGFEANPSAVKAANGCLDCCIDINECLDPSICSNGGQCTNVEPFYQCTCDTNEVWDPSSLTCVYTPINECEQNNTCDPDRAECVDQLVGYVCMCRKGYTMDQIAIDHAMEINGSCWDCCVDTNECQQEDICGEGGVCHNTDGSYTCNCRYGYTLNSKTGLCTPLDKNECEDVEVIKCNKETSVCRDLAAGYTCDCIDGYKPDPDALRETLESGCHECCVDRNECEEDDTICPQVCVNLSPPAKYKCVCKEDFRMIDNECVHPCTYNMALCRYDPNNGADSQYGYLDRECTPIGDGAEYTCACSQGYKFDLKLKLCVDIDECEENECDPTTSYCVNNIGSFECHCFDGYVKGDCQSCCIDVDECADSTSSCSDVCEFGTHASGAPQYANYTCACNKGRYISEDGINCENCQFEEWKPYSKCEGLCDEGKKTRIREISEGPSEGREECIAVTSETISCDTGTPCSSFTDCDYGSWNGWTDCSEKCDGGERTRSRFAVDPEKCNEIVDTEKESCNSDPCSNSIGVIIGAASGGLIIVGAIAFAFKYFYPQKSEHDSYDSFARARDNA